MGPVLRSRGCAPCVVTVLRRIPQGNVLVSLDSSSVFFFFCRRLDALTISDRNGRIFSFRQETFASLGCHCWLSFFGTSSFFRHLPPLPLDLALAFRTFRALFLHTRSPRRVETVTFSIGKVPSDLGFLSASLGDVDSPKFLRFEVRPHLPSFSAHVTVPTGCSYALLEVKQSIPLLCLCLSAPSVL